MAETTSGPVRRGESQWRAILSAFAGSGLSQKAFCEREGVAVSTFPYWKRRLGRRALTRNDSETTLDDASGLQEAASLNLDGIQALLDGLNQALQDGASESDLATDHFHTTAIATTSPPDCSRRKPPPVADPCRCGVV